MRKIKLAVFDWAGTTVDYGCVAPLAVFEKIFENKNIHLTREEILKPMGMGKRDHIETLLRTENATEQWMKCLRSSISSFSQFSKIMRHRSMVF